MSFSYQNNTLFVEDLDISKISQQVDTPFYCYSHFELQKNYQNFSRAFADVNINICYAIKASHNINIARLFCEAGAGVDVVSAGEIYRALKAGCDPCKIVFAGVGKTADEMKFALKNGVREFSVESEPELILLNEVAGTLGKKAKISLRVNPDVDGNTHEKISTGKKGDKFGIDIDLAPEIYLRAQKLKNLEIFGIATHIGSQITKLEPFERAFIKIINLFHELSGLGIKIKNLDFGGGIGILYKDETTILIEDYANLIKRLTKDLDVSLTIAPGRALVGEAGILVTKVIFVKKTSAKNYLIIDGAMNDLMRPGLYDSYHQVLPISKKEGEKEAFDLAGPVCETTDILAKNRFFASPKSGDLLAIMSAGAYGESMSNEYNSRLLIPEILVDGSNFKIIRRRPDFAKMIELEVS